MGAWVSQTHCSYLEVHLDRLVDNYKFLRALKGHQKFLCPMIKANAYGHGDLAPGSGPGGLWLFCSWCGQYPRGSFTQG